MPAEATPDFRTQKSPRKRRWLKRIGYTMGICVLILGVARLFAPRMVRAYVNRALDRNPMYDGKIGDVHLHLWRGAYSIDNVRLNKTTGNVPVPLFSTKRLELAIQWDAILHGKVVGKVRIEAPELNFVDGDDPSQSQTGAGGPWLQMLRDLFPFRLNSAEIVDGRITFLAVKKDPQVELTMTELNATLENFTNIYDSTAPLIATVRADGLVMDHARLNYVMKLDPFSYKPTFEMAVKLVGLDVTKLNSLTRAYGAFDFQEGWFDLVVEMKSREGFLDGYVKPLFRNLQIFSLKEDVPKDNPRQLFWEALLGTVTGVLTNQPRMQFGTMIPLSGQLEGPQTDFLAMIGNLLRNAFVRAYLPRLEGQPPDQAIEFGKGSVVDPDAPGEK